MCGRYSLFTDEETADINDIIAEVDRKYQNNNMKTGEIFPTNVAPVLISVNQKLKPELSIWGFPNFRVKGVIINARSETADEKRTFKDSMFSRRCVIPTTGFYEWSHDGVKQKYLFRIPQVHELYIAGFYNEFEGERRFVILTADANQSIADIHNRMPVVLEKNQINDWVFDFEKSQQILQGSLPMLEKALA